MLNELQILAQAARTVAHGAAGVSLVGFKADHPRHTVTHLGAGRYMVNVEVILTATGKELTGLTGHAHDPQRTVTR